MKITILLILTCLYLNTFGQNQFGIIKVTDNIGRTDSVIFGDDWTNGTIGVDSILGEIDYYGISCDSLEIRSIIRDTMCAYYIWYSPLNYSVNHDLKIDFRPAVGATLPENSNFTFYVNAYEYPVIVEITEFNFPGTWWTAFLLYDTQCQAHSEILTEYYDYQEIDTLFILDTFSPPFIRIYPEVLYDNVPSQKKELEVEVYPNPTSDNLIIHNQSEDLISICLYDIAGQKLFQDRINGSETKTTNITPLGKGIYVLKIEQKEKIDFIKILKE
ncbi:MAG: T9SS type A sorting domain-containing protein [bacterium]